jgi:hypothetical protein
LASNWSPLQGTVCAGVDTCTFADIGVSMYRLGMECGGRSWCATGICFRRAGATPKLVKDTLITYLSPDHLGREAGVIVVVAVGIAWCWYWAACSCHWGGLV